MAIIYTEACLDITSRSQLLRFVRLHSENKRESEIASE